MMAHFLRFMFLPAGQPWYTGAFWSNQTQWTVVWIPSLIIIGWREYKHHKELVHHVKRIHRRLNIKEE